MSNSYILGIDLGGTKIAAAAFDLAGKRLGKIARLPTMAAMQPAVTLMNLKRAAKQAAAEADLDGPPAAVGMGSTGPLDLRNQVLLDKDSLPRLVGFPIGKFVTEELGAPLYLENDAACFALGEARQGAGRGASVVVGITLGTGFGCGIVIDGQVFSGASHNAGEVAYCPLDGADYDSACSGGGVVRRYESLAGAARALDANRIGDLAEGGDATARTAWKAYGATVGAAVGTIAAVLDPSLVVIGGSVARRAELFQAELESAARKILAPPAAERFRLRRSQLGDAAGVTGAAELGRSEYILKAKETDNGQE